MKTRVLKIILALLLAFGVLSLQPLSQYNPETAFNPKGPPPLGVHLNPNAQRDIGWLSSWSWMRAWVRWFEIEEQAGVRSWGAGLDQDIRLMKATGNPLLLTIMTTPGWASLDPALRCSPPHPKYLPAYAEFVNAVIDRYQPQAVELYNEPEPSAELVGTGMDYFIGCWGPRGDYYAHMLQVVYPLIKAEHPDVLVAAGGLALDEGQREFWPQALAFGAQGHYDVLSFHGYAFYPLNEFDVLFERADYLRTRGETAPLWVTETSLLCLDEYVDCDAKFQRDQGDYFRHLLRYSQQNQIDVFFWFTLASGGWRHSDLVEERMAKPAWYWYQAASRFYSLPP